MIFQIVPVAEASVVTLMASVDKVIINPLIILLFALAMVYFLYGLARYLLSPDNEEIRKSSKSHMLWGIIGMFIMVSVFGIMSLLLSTVGESNINIESNGNYTVGNMK
jgi:predicted PurR-regulated permease PerM